jgi:hypothetical protein
MVFSIGDTVSHSVFGIGTVIGSKNQGLYLDIQFPKTRITIRSDVGAVARVGQSPAKAERARVEYEPSAVTASPPAAREAGVSPRSIIEAFRLGVVPYGAVKDFTFGREREVSIINKWLTSDSEGALIIKSGYGSGKSHLLDYINVLASENHFAVASAEFDQETPPYRPKLIYRQFIKSFRLNIDNRELSFRSFVRRIGATYGTSDSTDGYLDGVIQSVRHNREDDGLWDWIEGNRTYGYFGPTLYDNGTAANIYCHIISEIASEARNRLGAKGLVVILDEAERVTNATDIQQTKGWHFVRGLTMLAANDQRLKTERLLYDPTAVLKYVGKKTGLVYSGFNPRLAYCTNLPSFVKVVFAFTEDKYEMESWLGDCQISNVPMKLETLSESAFKDIFYHIGKLYEASYSLTFPDVVLGRAYQVVKSKTEDQNAVVRYFIKATVEALDILRFSPDLSPEDIE